MDPPLLLHNGDVGQSSLWLLHVHPVTSRDECGVLFVSCPELWFVFCTGCHLRTLWPYDDCAWGQRTHKLQLGSLAGASPKFGRRGHPFEAFQFKMLQCDCVVFSLVMWDGDALLLCWVPSCALGFSFLLGVTAELQFTVLCSCCEDFWHRCYPGVSHISASRVR